MSAQGAQGAQGREDHQEETRNYATLPLTERHVRGRLASVQGSGASTWDTRKQLERTADMVNSLGKHPNAEEHTVTKTTRHTAKAAIRNVTPTPKEKRLVRAQEKWPSREAALGAG